MSKIESRLRLRCPNRKMIRKLPVTCLTCHLFWLVFFPSCCSLMKLRQFWPFQPPPDPTKCFLTAKSSPQPSIHIFRKSKKKLATLPINIFGGMAPDRVNHEMHKYKSILAILQGQRQGKLSSQLEPSFKLKVSHWMISKQNSECVSYCGGLLIEKNEWYESRNPFPGWGTHWNSIERQLEAMQLDSSPEVGRPL